MHNTAFIEGLFYKQAVLCISVIVTKIKNKNKITLERLTDNIAAT